MAAITGYGGSVTFGGGAIVNVKSWDIDDQCDTEDVTGMASGATGRRDFAATLSGWSGSIEGIIDSTDSKFKGATPAIKAGASGTGTLVAGALGSYVGVIILTSVKTNTPVDGVVNYNIDFQGTGALTYPT